MKKNSALSEINNTPDFPQPHLLIMGLPLSFLLKLLIQTTCIAVFNVKLMFVSQLDIPHEDLLICYFFQALILVTSI